MVRYSRCPNSSNLQHRPDDGCADSQSFDFRRRARSFSACNVDLALGKGRYGELLPLAGHDDTLQNQLVADNSSYTVESGVYSDNFFDWRLGADMDLTPRNFLYITATTGHHSGGFNDNTTLPSGASLAATYKPERLYGYGRYSHQPRCRRNYT